MVTDAVFDPITSALRDLAAVFLTRISWISLNISTVSVDLRRAERSSPIESRSGTMVMVDDPLATRLATVKMMRRPPAPRAQPSSQWSAKYPTDSTRAAAMAPVHTSHHEVRAPRTRTRRRSKPRLRRFSIVIPSGGGDCRLHPAGEASPGAAQVDPGSEATISSPAGAAKPRRSAIARKGGPARCVHE